MAYYSDFKKYDVLNGIGTRHSLFMSGCSHQCEGCFNQEAWGYTFGKKFDKKAQERMLKSFDENRPIAGLSLLGGEPFDSSDDLIPFIRDFKDMYPNKSIWIWSGYLINEIIKNKSKFELLKLTNVLIDGKFEQDKKNLKLKWRGSSNQRVIDVQKSLAKDEVVIRLE